MSNRLTIAQLQKLQKGGFIKGYTVPPPVKGAAGTKAPKKGSKTKAWIALHLQAWCTVQGHALVSEHRFHPVRRWRFDWCIPAIKVAIEYEGVMSDKSRHTTVTGFSGDSEKYSQAALLGWSVLRYTVMTHKNLLSDLDRLKSK